MLDSDIQTIILWLRGVEGNLENLQQSPIWQGVTGFVEGDYLSTNYDDSLGNAIGQVSDLANRMQELKERLKTEGEEQ